MYFGCWSIADAAINITLLTFQGRSERSAWLRHFDKLADRNGSTLSEADRQSCTSGLEKVADQQSSAS